MTPDERRAKKAAYARTPAERAKRTAYMRAWREKNREKHNLQALQSHHRNKHKHVGKWREQHLLKTYGITAEEKRQMVEAQNGLCLICEEPFKSTRSTHVDHCHETGKVRGILCHVCNTKLGWYEKYADKIEGYLKL